MPRLTLLESELREVARELIARGRLPRHAPNRVWGGTGSGLPCALCGKVIPAAEVEYETDSSVDGSIRTFHFHFVCHAAWQLECLRADFTTHSDARSGDVPTAPHRAPRSDSAKRERSALRRRFVFFARPVLSQQLAAALSTEFPTKPVQVGDQ